MPSAGPVSAPDSKGGIGGVILAAGRSRRMGKPKQLLLLGGRPLLQHVVDSALDSALEEIVLVLGYRAEEIRSALCLSDSSRLRIVIHGDFEAGQSSSLRCGLRAFAGKVRAAAVLLGDQPGVNAELIDRMAQAFCAQEAPALRPVYRTRGGLVPGHPVLVAKALWPEVEALRGDLGLRELFSRHPEWLAQVELEGEPLPDVDTPEAYRRIVDAE